MQMAQKAQQRKLDAETFPLVRIVPQQTAFVIERFGRYKRTLEPGLHVLIPGVSAMVAGDRNRAPNRDACGTCSMAVSAGGPHCVCAFAEGVCHSNP